MQNGFKTRAVTPGPAPCSIKKFQSTYPFKRSLVVVQES